MLNIPSFYERFSSSSSSAGVVVGVFLATFIPVGSRYGNPAVGKASDALGAIVQRLAPQGSVVGYLSRLAYGIFLPGGGLANGQHLADDIRTAAAKVRIEVHPGEGATVAAAVGVVESLDRSDHWEVLEKLAKRIAKDLDGQFPPEWQYPVLIYPK